MSLLCRLAGRQLCSQLVKNEGCSLMYIRPVTMKATTYKPVIVKNHDEHNKKLLRPLSPHLTIYKPQLTSMLSISHRITGAISTGFMFGIAASSVLPWDWATIVSAIDNLHVGVVPIFLAKVILTLPVVYHFINGIRHLIWDFGKCLGLKEVYNTGYVTVVAVLALTIGIVLL